MLENLLNDPSTCRCGGKGWYLDREGTQFKERTCGCKLAPVARESNRVASSDWLNTHIPNQQYRIAFHAESLIGVTNPAIASTPSYKHYVRTMLHLLNKMSEGLLPQYSYYLCAPKGYGKKYFVYTMMHLAYQRGYNPSPLYSIWKIVDARMRFDQEYMNTLFTYELLFVTINARINKETIRILQFLLDECEMRGIPLIVITKYPVETIYQVEPHFDYKILPALQRTGAYGEMLYVSAIPTAGGGNPR